LITADGSGNARRRRETCIACFAPNIITPSVLSHFLVWNECESVIDLQIFLGFDCFRLVRQCKVAEGDEPPPYYWCNFEGQHIRGKDIVVIEFVSFSNSFGKSMILR